MCSEKGKIIILLFRCLDVSCHYTCDRNMWDKRATNHNSVWSDQPVVLLSSSLIDDLPLLSLPDARGTYSCVRLNLMAHSRLPRPSTICPPPPCCLPLALLRAQSLRLLKCLTWSLFVQIQRIIDLELIKKHLVRC